MPTEQLGDKSGLSDDAGSTREHGAPLNGFAVASLTTGVLALCGGGVAASIAAIVTGNVAMSGLGRFGDRGKGAAVFGQVAGYISLLASLIILAAVVAFAAAVGPQLPAILNGAVSNVVTGGVTNMLSVPATGTVDPNSQTPQGYLDPNSVIDPNTGMLYDGLTMLDDGTVVDPNGNVIGVLPQ